MRAAVLAVLVASTSIASAQPALTEPIAITDRSEDAVSPTTATLLSLGGSVVGVATIWMGSKMHGGDTPIMETGAAIALIAPSSGQWYSRGTAYFTPGLGMRLGGAMIMALGFGAALDNACQGGGPCDVPIRDHNSDTLIGLGAAIAVGGMIFDVATAGSEARKANRERRVSLQPTVMPTAHGTTTGLGLSGAF
jgi:hypothetical protein